MSDHRLRNVERQAQADPSPEVQARLLKELMCGGELAGERVQLSASLGHTVAMVLCPEAEQVNWGDRDTRRKDNHGSQ